MKNLEKLVNECKNDIESLGIELGEIADISINRRAKSRYGRCRYIISENAYYIEIAEELLDDNVDDMSTKNTIAHELLHAMKGCVGMNHKGNWITCANMMNDIYGYNIKRTTSRAEKGLKPKERRLPKYIIRCQNCDSRWCYYKRTKMVKNIQCGASWMYRCGKCGSNDLVVFNKEV